LRDVERFLELGVDYITLGDTTGVATPVSIKRLFGAMQSSQSGATAIAHLHDTRGTALANCVAALEAGVRYFDCAFGGVGGHPVKVKYGGGYTGNVCTEDLVGLFESMGVHTGIDKAALLETVQACEDALGRELQGRVARSGLNPLFTEAESV
jgi:hydroxymethylglutaryl-CoA lyase